MTEHLDDDAVVQLALGQLEAESRSAMATHLLTCSTCRGAYDEAAAAVEDLLSLVPEVQPPVGFESRVLARLGAEPARPVPTRARARRWLAAAAAVVVLAAAAAVLGAVVSDDDQPARPEVVALTRDDGGEVGTISVTERDGDQVVVVAVTDAPRDAPYSCRMTLADGTVVDAGPWTPHDGHGAWTVPLPGDAGDLTKVELVIDATGETWSTAAFES